MSLSTSIAFGASRWIRETHLHAFFSIIDDLKYVTCVYIHAVCECGCAGWCVDCSVYRDSWWVRAVGRLRKQCQCSYADTIHISREKERENAVGFQQKTQERTKRIVLPSRTPRTMPQLQSGPATARHGQRTSCRIAASYKYQPRRAQSPGCCRIYKEIAWCTIGVGASCCDRRRQSILAKCWGGFNRLSHTRRLTAPAICCDWEKLKLYLELVRDEGLRVENLSMRSTRERRKVINNMTTRDKNK